MKRKLRVISSFALCFSMVMVVLFAPIKTYAKEYEEETFTFTESGTNDIKWYEDEDDSERSIVKRWFSHSEASSPFLSVFLFVYSDEDYDSAKGWKINPNTYYPSGISTDIFKSLKFQVSGESTSVNGGVRTGDVITWDGTSDELSMEGSNAENPLYVKSMMYVLKDAFTCTVEAVGNGTLEIRNPIILPKDDFLDGKEYLKVTPNDGEEFVCWEAKVTGGDAISIDSLEIKELNKDKRFEEGYTHEFTMPAKDITLTAHFTSTGLKPAEVYYAPLVADLKANEEGVIEWEAGDSLPLEAVKLLVEKPELSLEFTFTYEGAEHTIFIPAGAFEQYYDVNIPWYGPAWLIERFEKPQKDVNEYIIVKDDTLNALAEKFKCTVEEILALNPYITNPNLIYSNNKLLIPVKK